MSSSGRAPRVCVGIFVGGASRRMGTPKGLLLEPRTAAEHSVEPARRTLVERLASEARCALGALADPGGAEVVLVGARPEYAHLGLPLLADAATEVGPLGGLVALLEHAAAQGHTQVLALACDQPFVTAALLQRLLAEHPGAQVYAPRSEGRWQPLCARYEVTSALAAGRAALARRDLSLQLLLGTLAATELVLSPAEQEQLVDWDRPEDVTGSLR